MESLFFCLQLPHSLNLTFPPQKKLGAVLYIVIVFPHSLKFELTEKNNSWKAIRMNYGFVPCIELIKATHVLRFGFNKNLGLHLIEKYTFRHTDDTKQAKQNMLFDKNFDLLVGKWQKSWESILTGWGSFLQNGKSGDRNYMFCCLISEDLFLVMHLCI